MKTTLLLLTAFFLIACGGEQSSNNFNCDEATGVLLSQVQPNQQINMLSPELQLLFDSMTPAVFTDGEFCNKSYNFNQFNTNTLRWCYYYDIDVNCETGIIEHIFFEGL